MYICRLARLLSLGILPGLFWVWNPVPAGAAYISLDGSDYFQGFESLAGPGGLGVLPPGWGIIQTPGNSTTRQVYDAARARSSPRFRMDPGGSIRRDDGSGNSSGVVSFGNAGSGDPALGTLRNGQGGALGFGAAFQNTGASTLGEIIISYTGEEWRLGSESRGPDALKFQYSLNAHSLTTGHWISVSALDFLTPNLFGVGRHDGNLPANQTFLSATLSGLDIPAGGTIWIRWLDQKLTARRGEDGLAIDNFTFTAVPEASTWLAASTALVLLGVALWRSCKRAAP